MKGRTQTKSKKKPSNKIKSGVKVAAAKKFFSSAEVKIDRSAAKAQWHKDNLRFGISLVVLTALLEAALFIFLLTLNGSAGLAVGKTKVIQAPSQAKVMPKKMINSGERTLKDDNLAYEITIPKEVGDWMYKTGYVKSVVDDVLVDGYLQVYAPLPVKTEGNKFDNRYQNILTVMRFTEKEWNDISKGCEKSNLYFCETQGKEIGRKDGYVYSYTKPTTCPKEISNICGRTDQIVESFKLK